jgi:hypothetical protein
MVVFDAGKKAFDVSLEDIYKDFPEAKTVGDLMRMFPLEYIINGIALNIDKTTDIRSVVQVVPTMFSLSSTPKYTVKGQNFGYDDRMKVIIKAPIEQ